MFRLLGRRIGGLNRFLRLVSLFATVVMVLTGRGRKANAAEQPVRTRATEL
ncbi:MAG: hypothetical protein IT323_08275 [Anaerolineae bacterium]|nr:hypothetical protein [Anaerolineae bacterium]